jgi:hypothetical protein
VGILAKDGDTDGVFFEVQHHAHDVAGELHEFTGHDVLQTVDAGDAVTHLQDGADALHFEVAAVLVQLLRQDGADFLGPQFHCRTP